ncbi:SHOCT domain-containing protein [Streptomyces sp. NBC_01591]|uniref:SHOCT domain-containing protein n=1 Tax=Streptomyces sp. NBC_01591 TaxID=2975888 RepID=UPI002DDB3F2C|nr:SHOCT domain-containing protein [Streptomyces sp. NBC_01591]WSD67006.1 SHOCT domain-containing protein [Streptomyces sp. NBC_01591]
MPGLLRGVARTAVIAGTATSVSNRVSRRQAGRWARQDAEQAQARPAPAAPPPAPTSLAPEDEMSNKIAQLKDLGDLKSQGVLSESEFEAQKARILAT